MRDTSVSYEIVNSDDFNKQKNGIHKTMPKKVDLVTRIFCLSRLPTRYVLVFLGFCGFFNLYSLRVNLNVTMVAMVRSHFAHEAHTDTHSEACPALLHDVSTFNSSYGSNSHHKDGEFDWDSREQGLILGSFFYGYVITQLPGGVLAEKYSAKWVFGTGIFITSVLTLITPIAARLSLYALTCLRILEGLAEGVVFPAMSVILARWSPKMERSRMHTFMGIGCSVGTVITYSISGFLCDSGFLGGWPSVFYFFGTLGCVWFFFWAAVIYDNPEDNPVTSQQEFTLIRKDREDQGKIKPPIPWKHILTSRPLWALSLTSFGSSWGFYTLLIELPTYMANILHYDIKSNGLLSSFPSLVEAFCSVIVSTIGDKIRETSTMRVTTIRKIFASIGVYGQGITLICLAFVGCRPTAVMTLLLFSATIGSCMSAGHNVAHIDMSPEYAGVLMGIINCCSNFAGFLAPTFVGYILHNGQTLENWRTIFLNAGLLAIVVTTVFNLFGSSEPQPWSSGIENSDNKEMKPLVTSDDDEVVEFEINTEVVELRK